MNVETTEDQSRHDKWIVRVLVNTDYLSKLDRTSDPKKPVGGNKYFHDNVLIIAHSHNNPDKVVFGNDSHFELEVSNRDEVFWYIEAMAPFEEDRNNNLLVALYGIEPTDPKEWDKYFERLVARNEKHLSAPFVQKDLKEKITVNRVSKLLGYTRVDFEEDEPKLPKTLGYHFKLVLYQQDYKIQNKSANPINFIKVDPKITLKKSIGE